MVKNNNKNGGRSNPTNWKNMMKGRSDLLCHEASRLTKTGKKVATKDAAINDGSENRNKRNKRNKGEVERIHGRIV